ncbi:MULTISPECIES: FecR domain-containing protein [unclassified Phenylobacterium]|uniref:FecR family protein n=1 Tax=unclassified Phenylobacterium TaxID=2640670 RepID=UPI0022B346E5|nr:FecR domain-containing protein [Phenylobacterium sp. NIBR 498073]WGU39315.1 FecR domain-containing protein [Phenylobacterium sp. NIBR 498073]
MNDNQRQIGPSGSPDAASWFVRLQRHPDDRDVQNEFETWLAADPAHRDDWALVSGAWDRIGDLKDDPQVMAAREALKADLAAERRRPHMRWAAGIAATVLAAGSMLGYGSWRQAQDQNAAPAAVVAAAPQALAVYRTPIGGQQVVTLQDGSRVTLSTDTEVRLTDWNKQRSLTLVRGEAYFEVAKNPDKPFVVSAEGRTVTALGTAFDVRVDPGEWSVSLIEGKVRVAGAHATVDMAPGQHLAQSGSAPWTLEARNLADLTSWREGSLVFENRPLASIVQEMNRYSTRKVRIADARLAATPLSGRFRTGDMAGFVATLEAYGMVKAGHTSANLIDLYPPAGE